MSSRRPRLAEQDAEIVLRRWEENFERVRGEIQAIEHRREIHNELIAELMRVGDNVEGAVAVAQYVDQTYDVTQLAAIRRLVDPDERSVSLHSLLAEMAQQASASRPCSGGCVAEPAHGSRRGTTC
jgi:hypothetical protein